MNEPTSSPGDASGEAVPPATSVWSRMFNVFAAPDDVFAEVKASPRAMANWLLPALLLVLIGWAGAWLVARDPVLQQQQREIQDRALARMAAKQQWSEQQLEEVRRRAEAHQALGTGIGVFGVPLVSAVVATFWWAWVLWLVGAKGLRGSFDYGKALEAAGLVAMIEVLNKILTPLLQLALGTVFAAPGLALAVAGEFQAGDPLHLVLASVNGLDLWGIVVSAIAVARLSGASFARSLAWLLAIWIPWKAVLIGVSLLTARLFGG
ncbi:MAG: YIP1 family protein [Verrucomicrobia bacterium]|nr:YIP1 family protein [Verrucomicrobiota bacterium]